MSAALGRVAEEALEGVLREVVALQPVPGLVCAITLDGEIVFARALGVTDVEAPAPVTLDTLFPVASVTKVVTAAALHAEVARGGMSLDATAGDLLPEVEWSDPRAPRVTLAQLLSHTAGLDDFDPLAWADAPELDDGALGREVARTASRRLLFDPGAAHRYSNAGYDTAGLALARAAGTSYEAAAGARVLGPLAMEGSGFFPHAPAGVARAVGHLADGRGRAVPYRGALGTRAHAPCGTLASSGRNLARLAAALAEPARAPVPGLEHLARRVAPTGRADGAWSGLGLRTRDRAGARVHEHGGWDPGFRCALAAIPSCRSGAIVLTNYHWSWPGVLECLLDAITGVAPRLGADERAALRAAAPAGRVSA